MTSKIIAASALALALLAPAVSLADTSTGLLNVYVQVINPTNFNNTSYSPSNFQVSVYGSSPSPATFQGSQSGVLVTLNPGTYTVNVTDQYGFTPSYSVGCDSSILAGQTQLCVITMSGSAYYNPVTNVYPWTAAPPPLSCRSDTPTVALGQAARFSVIGGAGGTYNWSTGSQNFPNVGPVLTTSFSQSGSQSVTVTNAGQTAVCNVNVLSTYAPAPISPGFVPYQQQAYSNYSSPVVYTNVVPSLPNTGIMPSNGAEMAFALVLVMGAAMIGYPYARKAFAIAVR